MKVNYQKLINILQKRKIQLSKIANDLSLSSATIAKINKGEYLSLQTLESICKYLNVNLDDILSFNYAYKPNSLYKRLKEEMTNKISGGIYHETQILMTYNSNHIEGSKLTSLQTRYIFETNSIALENNEVIEIDDIIETKNHFKCVDYIILNAFKPLNESLIKKLHQLLKSETKDAKLSWFNVGDYKKVPYTVGGSQTTDPKNVKDEMIKLIGLYENKKEVTFNDIVEFHYQFEKIHPFQDGNGRVGRLIAFKECLRHGFVPFTIDDEIKLFYYRGLKEYESEKGYLTDTCLEGQDKYKKLLDLFKINYKEE